MSHRIHPIRFFLLHAALGVALACGCGNDTEPAGPGRGGSTTNQGIFIDARCAGLDYVAARGTDDEIIGVTDANGTFTYVPGENVVFLIGGLCLPEPSENGIGEDHIAEHALGIGISLLGQRLKEF